MLCVCTVKLNLQATNSKRRAYGYESSNMWCYVRSIFFILFRVLGYFLFGCFASYFSLSPSLVLSLFQFDTITLKQKPNETHQTDRHETCGFHIPHRIHSRLWNVFSFVQSHSISLFFCCSRSYSLLCLLLFLVQSSPASSGRVAVVSMYTCLRAASTLSSAKWLCVRHIWRSLTPCHPHRSACAVRVTISTLASLRCHEENPKRIHCERKWKIQWNFTYSLHVLWCGSCTRIKSNSCERAARTRLWNCEIT